MTVAVSELAAARQALDEFMETARRHAATWASPRAPGKWSPSQLVEHIARSLEASANDINGKPTMLPSLPAPLRLLARTLVFERVLKRRLFPKARTNRAMDPQSGSDTVGDAVLRIERAWQAFADAVDSTSQSRIRSVVFGRVDLEDYVRFQELHIRHHRLQFDQPAA